MKNTEKTITSTQTRHIIITAVIFLFILLLNGCLNYSQEVILYPDGSGKMKIDYWMKFVNAESEKVVENLGIFNPDSIRTGFQSEYSHVENVAVYRDTTDSTTHALIELSFQHIDSLNRTKVFAEYNFSYQEKTGGQIIFKQFVPPIATGFGSLSK